jgi:hypothetical protein
MLGLTSDACPSTASTSIRRFLKSSCSVSEVGALGYDSFLLGWMLTAVGIVTPIVVPTTLLRLCKQSRDWSPAYLSVTGLRARFAYCWELDWDDGSTRLC